jgi:Na+/H+ antiporter NhaD/arsenite permease-like protein
MPANVVALAVFVVCYALFALLPRGRSWVACGGALALVLAGVVTWHDAFFAKVHWNVIALFFGTLILAELFMQSRAPAVLAEMFVDRAKTARGAMVAVCVLSSALSAFVENVAVVLLVAPVALSLCEKLNARPVKLLILIATFSNLQGTATLIGDPPSMILGGYMKMSFNDFFVYHGRPGIFFAVQIGAAAAVAVAWWLLRDHKEPAEVLAVEKLRSWVPSILMIALMVGLSLCSTFDPDFKWLAGTMTLALAAVGLVWFMRLTPRWGSTREMIKTLDWDTTLFLMGVFVLVGGLTDSGWLDRAAEWMTAHFGDNLLEAFITIVVVSVVISAFVDNVPYLLAMIPVTQKVADTLGAPVPLLMFGLLIGACLGGNITPIGASANVVSIGILRKAGHPVGFKEFMSVGIPFTIAAVTAACLFTWWIWAP